MGKFVAAVLLTALPLAGCAEKHYTLKRPEPTYSIEEVRSMMKAARTDTLYFSLPEMSYSLEMAGRDSVMFIAGLINRDETYRRLPPNDKKLRDRFDAAADDDLWVRIRGVKIADEECDYYSAIGGRVEIGEKITPKNQSDAVRIIDDAGRALAQVR